MSLNEPILAEIDGEVGMLTLNRAHVHNAMDSTMADHAVRILESWRADASIRAVIVAAAGANFCIGQDADSLRRCLDGGEPCCRREFGANRRLFDALAGLGRPSIARIQGAAYGPGLGLVAACDLAVATYDAHFAVQETRLGLSPGPLAGVFADAVGVRAARRYLMSGERFSAVQALRIGLVHEIVPGENELDEAVRELAHALLGGAPQALAGSRIIESPDAALEAQVTSAATVEARVGINAFLESRAAPWDPRRRM